MPSTSKGTNNKESSSSKQTDDEGTSNGASSSHKITINKKPVIKNALTVPIISLYLKLLYRKEEKIVREKTTVSYKLKDEKLLRAIIKLAYSDSSLFSMADLIVIYGIIKEDIHKTLYLKQLIEYSTDEELLQLFTAKYIFENVGGSCSKESVDIITMLAIEWDSLIVKQVALHGHYKTLAMLMVTLGDSPLLVAQCLELAKQFTKSKQKKCFAKVLIHFLPADKMWQLYFEFLKQEEKKFSTLFRVTNSVSGQLVTVLVEEHYKAYMETRKGGKPPTDACAKTAEHLDLLIQARTVKEKKLQQANKETNEETKNSLLVKAEHDYILELVDCLTKSLREIQQAYKTFPTKLRTLFVVAQLFTKS